MNQLRSAKGVYELQKNGHTLVQKVRELKEENRRKIQEHIDMLRKESTSANKKVHIIRNLFYWHYWALLSIFNVSCE